VWRESLVGTAAGLVAAWLALLVALLVARPRGPLLAESLRLLPDLLRLLTALARDPGLPRGVRARLGLLMAYLAMPLDLVPDVLPVVGFADDAVVVVWALRSVVRAVGEEEVRRHWPGSDDGFAALRAVCRL
jgi:uncharacterized membrane protein YkvA (DUF1232 family)